VGADPRRQPARPAAGQLLGEDGVGEVAQPGAAPLALVLQPQPPRARQRAEHGVGKRPRRLPAIGVGKQLRLHPRAHPCAQALMLGIERRHGIPALGYASGLHCGRS
jgi:hypothetical protein